MGDSIAAVDWDAGRGNSRAQASILQSFSAYGNIIFIINTRIFMPTSGLLSTELTVDTGPKPVRDLICVCWGIRRLHWE